MSSIDDRLKKEGFKLLEVFENKNPVNLIKFLEENKNNKYREYRIIPCDISLKDSDYLGKPDAHSIYVKK